MNYKPMDDFILVKPDLYSNECTTPGGLTMLKSQSQETLVTGEVVAIGLPVADAMKTSEGVLLQKCIFHTVVGDRVQYDKSTAREVMVDGVMYNILKEGYCYAKLV
jgi:co-chaperonin GroES (HSP10)